MAYVHITGANKRYTKRHGAVQTPTICAARNAASPSAAGIFLAAAGLAAAFLAAPFLGLAPSSAVPCAGFPASACAGASFLAGALLQRPLRREAPGAPLLPGARKALPDLPAPPPGQPCKEWSAPPCLNALQQACSLPAPTMLL